MATTPASTRPGASTYRMSETRRWLADTLTDPVLNARFVDIQRRCAVSVELAQRVLLCEDGAYDEARRLVDDVYAFFGVGQVDADEDLFGVSEISTAVLAVDEIDNDGGEWTYEIKRWVRPLLLQGRYQLDTKRLAALAATERERPLSEHEQQYRSIIANRRRRTRGQLADDHGIEVAR